jgi:hypothetical protein
MGARGTLRGTRETVMTANELRIGNLVDTAVGIIRVEEIPLKSNPLYNTNALHAIPITEEWLLKFGFERHPWGLVINGLLFRDNIKTPCKELTLEVGNGFKTKVGYVHQLQNLYFVLTGEELNIEL